MQTVTHRLAVSLVLLASVPGLASVPTPAFASTAPVQLLQPGDSQMGCDALISEINQLAQAEAAPEPKKKRGIGVGRLLSMAAPALPLVAGANPLANMVIGQAASMAQQGAMDQQMQAMTAAAAPAGLSIAAQRKERLMGFFQQKGC